MLLLTVVRADMRPLHGDGSGALMASLRADSSSPGMKLILILELSDEPTNDVWREVDGEEPRGDPVPVGVEGEAPGGRCLMSGRSVWVVNVGNEEDGTGTAPVGGAGRVGVFLD